MAFNFPTFLFQPRSVENSRNSRSMESLDRPTGQLTSANQIHSNQSTSSQNRRTSTESGPNPDSKPVKKRSTDETSRRKSSTKSESPAVPSSSSSSAHKTRSSENRRSRTEMAEPSIQPGPSPARSMAVLQSTINPILSDVSKANFVESGYRLEIRSRVESLKSGT